MKKQAIIAVLGSFTLAVTALTIWYMKRMPGPKQWRGHKTTDSTWIAPSLSELPANDSGDMIRYGHELIANTGKYFGPRGTIAPLSNGMNCQNCHLDAGTRMWGNNYAAVASCYPRFRARSGTVESILKRVNDCFDRSLNGTAPDSNSKEMKAIIAYITWLGKDVPKNKKPYGTGIRELKLLARMADTARGKTVYAIQCTRCHGSSGQGVAYENGSGYVYPPLWGPHSYNTGAGLYRLSRAAGYIHDNMPYTATHGEPQLSDEDAWDVAAYINSQPRPTMDISKDWPDIKGKPYDNPFGPYADSFSQTRHKYGPYAGMKTKS